MAGKRPSSDSASIRVFERRAAEWLSMRLGSITD